LIREALSATDESRRIVLFDTIYPRRLRTRASWNSVLYKLNGIALVNHALDEDCGVDASVVIVGLDNVPVLLFAVSMRPASRLVYAKAPT
jgi:hypothetical protein